MSRSFHAVVYTLLIAFSALMLVMNIGYMRMVDDLLLQPVCEMQTDGWGRFKCSKGCTPVSRYKDGQWSHSCENL